MSLSRRPAIPSPPEPERAGPSRRVVLEGAGLLTTSVLLAACGGSTSAGSPKGSNTPSADSPSTGTTGHPVVLTDQRGTKITLAGPARRVVTIPMPAASILVAVDQGVDHLVGMHQASWAAMKDGILGEIFPQALKIAHGVADNSFAPNVESILALHPDLVIQWGDDGTGITAPLENAGLAVAGLSYGQLDDVKTWISLFAKALGKPDRATKLNARIDAARRKESALAAKQSGPAPKILYFNRFQGGLKVAGTGSFNDFYIKLIGGTNPASGPHGAPGKGMVGVDTEQVLAWDPDIVLLGNFDEAQPADVYTPDVWRGLTAVRNRTVYKVPLGGYRWDPPSHESPLMWRWLSMVAFPDQKPFDLRADVVRSYRLYYDYEPSAAQLDTMLWTKANADSAHYEQFDAS